MPGTRGKRDKLFQEWTQHSGLPEAAVPRLETESEPGDGRYLPRIGLNLGCFSDNSLVLMLIGVSVVLSLVNLILLSITVYVLTNFVK